MSTEENLILYGDMQVNTLVKGLILLGFILPLPLRLHRKEMWIIKALIKIYKNMGVYLLEVSITILYTMKVVHSAGPI